MLSYPSIYITAITIKLPNFPSPGLTSTLEFVYYVEPVMAASILPLSLVMEG